MRIQRVGIQRTGELEVGGGGGQGGAECEAATPARTASSERKRFIIMSPLCG